MFAACIGLDINNSSLISTTHTCNLMPPRLSSFNDNIITLYGVILSGPVCSSNQTGFCSS